MRKLLTILLLTLSAATFSQTNPNSVAYSYSTLAQAIKAPKDPEWKVTVSEPLVGGTFTVKLRSQGYVPDGGTIIACADSVSALVRDISQVRGIHLSWFGIKADGVTDNYAKLKWLTSAACPLSSHLIIDRPGVYNSSQSIVPERDIVLDAPDGYEMVNAGTTKFTFPQGVNGFVFNNINSAGSILRGFTIQSTLPEFGRILEYNSTTGTMLYLAPYSVITAGKTFEFKDVYHPEKVKGTAVISTVGANNINYSITYYSKTGTFAIGDTVKGTTSGAKAVVRFVSKLYNALAVGTVSGTFTFGETITGTASGATAKFYQKPTPNSFSYARVATINNVTGSLDAAQTDTSSTTDPSIVGADTTQFAVTGNIDSLGITGKRQNIFIEAGKYNVGILVNRRITLEDMTITAFGGNGIYVSNLTSAGSTNANLCRFNRVRSSLNAANGIEVEGGDANAVTITNSTFVADGGFGICDLSFLGIAVSNPHSSSCLVGAYTSANYVNRKSNWSGIIYSEGGYVLKPWQMEENNIGGSSGAIGGVWGQDNVTPKKSTGKNSGYWFDEEHLQNNNLYTDNSNIRNPAIVFKGQGTQSVPAILEQGGNGGGGRGPTLGYRIPAGGGYNGVDPMPASLYMGGIQGTTVGASNYALDFWERRNVPPAITITSATGTGAILQADILNGKIIKVNVLASGKSYPINSTTLSIANAPGTTLVPIIGDSSFLDVLIQGDSLTTNPDNDIYSVWKLRNDGAFYPTVAGGYGSIGTSTNPVLDIWATNIHTSGAASSQYIWNGSTFQTATFNIGSNNPMIITNHGSVSATANPNITNPGLIIAPRAGADGYYSPFHINQNAAASGMHFSTWGNNLTSIMGGGYYRTLANGILGGYYFLDSLTSGIAFSKGTLHLQVGRNTIGAVGPVVDAAVIDTAGQTTFTSKPGAPSVVYISRTIGANTGVLSIGGSDGRNITSTNNGTSADVTFNALNAAFNANLKIGQQKAITFTTFDGTISGFNRIIPASNFDWQFITASGAHIGMAMDSSGRLKFGAQAQLHAYTVATLPTGAINDMVMVSDALAPVNGSAVAGGGAVRIPVFYNGSNWIVMGAGSSAGGVYHLPYNGNSLYYLGGDSALHALPVNWQRIGTTLSPLIAGDSISTTGKLIGGSIRIADGTQGAGKVLTSDASGNGSWQTPAAGGTSFSRFDVTTASATVPDVAGFKTVVLVNYTGGTSTITLPAAGSNQGKEVVVKSITSNSVTITPVFISDANTIGASSYGAITYYSNGTTWYLIGH
jgi:hypothetical protein